MSNRTERLFRFKMQLAFTVWRRRDLSPAMRLVFTVLLIGHHNVETGKCNPSYETLASECAMTRRAAIRIISALEEKGLVAIKVSVGRKNTNSFSFPALKMVAGEPPKGKEKVTQESPFKGREKVTLQTEMVTPLARNGDSGVTQNIKEHIEHSEASPSPLDSAASASLKKANGQQGELDEKQEREANLAKLAETAAMLKKMGANPNPPPPPPPPPPRMKGPKRYVATEADLRLFDLQALGVDVDENKPAPIVLEPVRLDNVSIFPSPIVSGDDCPPLPDFLNRKKWQRPTISEEYREKFNN